jgi:hypothetical protein
MVLLVYLAVGLFLHFAFVRYFWLMLALATVAARICSRQIRSASC